MKKTYIVLCVVALCAVAAAYWSGGRVSTEKCRAEVAEISAASAVAAQNEITQTKGKINAEAYNTGAADIRARLRKHYTIKD